VREPLPLSLLNDYLYCPRRAALKVVEGWRSANEHTSCSDITPEGSDRDRKSKTANQKLQQQAGRQRSIEL